VIKNPSPSWATWHERQAKNWKEYELKHFCSGTFIMEQWNRDRLILSENRINEEFDEIKLSMRVNGSGSGLEEYLINPTIVFNQSGSAIGQEYLSGLNTYQEYLALKSESNRSKISDFYFDVFYRFFQTGNQYLALRVLSNLVELEFDNPQYLRLMFFALNAGWIEEEDWELSLHRTLIKIRGEEPHSYLNLAQALIEKAIRETVPGREEKVYDLYIEAIENLNKVILGKWDKRFTQIELIAIQELNRLYNYVQRNVKVTQKVNTFMDKRLITSVACDIRIIVQWDTDMSDVELHVIEPTGEKCYSFHNQTKLGGFLSRDFTGGYGPEEYLLKRAIPGEYKVYIKLNGGIERKTGTTVLVKIFTHFAKPNKERIEKNVVRLDQKKQVLQVATINF